MKTKTIEDQRLDQLAPNRTFPPNMTTQEKRLYLKNLEDILDNERTGFNLDYTERLKDSNHRLIANHHSKPASA